MSNDIAISVENLSKCYRIQHQAKRPTSFAEAVRGAVASPFKYLGDRMRKADESELFWALKDVSFEVKRGEVIGIIGRNGAGKSTLLKILSRITDPTSGHAEIRGRVNSLLEVGTGFHPELSGRENIYMNAAMHGMKRAEINAKLDEIIAFAEVEKFIDTPVKRYSSGMSVRLAFAVAAHLDPDIMILDEVLAVGDVAFQKKCLGQMGKVAEAGRTILFVSHNMQAVRQFCSRCVWLKDGRMRRDGLGADVVSEYCKDATMGGESIGLRQQIVSLPPDPAFRLLDIQVTQDGVPTLDVVNGSPIEIKFEYDVFETLHGLHVYFLLYDQDGTLLFESLNNGDFADLPTNDPDRYESRAILPADFLSEGRYEMKFAAGIHSVRGVIPHQLVVPLTVIGTGKVNRAYPGYRTPGKLSPWIPWENRRIEKE